MSARVAPCRLYWDKTQTRIVTEGPEAAFLFRGAGQGITDAEWEAHGLDRVLAIPTASAEEASESLDEPEADATEPELSGEEE